MWAGSPKPKEPPTVLTIELCQRCGFDVPSDAGACPQCVSRGDLRPVGLAARQVAGLAPPTRSVHPLSTLTPRHERKALRRRRPSWAADLFAYATLLALSTVVMRLVSLVAHTDRFTVQLAPITLDRLDRAVAALAWATALALALTVIALVVRAVRVLGDRVLHHGAPLPG